MTFTDRYPQHHSVEFAAQAAAQGMQEIGNLVDSRQIYKIPKPDGTDLTNGDIAVDNRIHEIYAPFDRDVLIYSEERPFPTPRAENRHPILRIHEDPNDGTTDFWQQYQKSVQTGEPMLSGAMLSMGGIYEGEGQPHWGVIGAPFLRDGPRLYVAKTGGETYCLDPRTGEKIERKPQAKTIGKKVIMLASKNSVEKFGPNLINAGFDVALNQTSVANMLSVCDPTLIEQFRPDLKGRAIGGAVLGNCHDWDIAGILPFAAATGRIVTGKTGEIRSIGRDERGGVVADNQETHEILMDVISTFR